MDKTNKERNQENRTHQSAKKQIPDVANLDVKN